MANHIYLQKDNDDLVSHCQCKTALITFPPQMDCPWCGCGWLFTCIQCRKAFTFARGVEIAETWEEIARRDLRGRAGSEPSNDDVSRWVDAMKIILKDVRVGQQYIVLDGWMIETTNKKVHIEGWHALHRLDFIPQVKALKDSTVLPSILANKEYWVSNALKQSGP